MISNCIFTWGFTSWWRKFQNRTMLWIDFKLYFYVRIHKKARYSVFTGVVVNWFQIVFLREDSQATNVIAANTSSCELISNCIFTWGFTSAHWKAISRSVLWIDFKLYFYVRIHKLVSVAINVILVVNWFQIVFLREDSQACHMLFKTRLCCELISNCIFTWGFTSSKRLRLWCN